MSAREAMEKELRLMIAQWEELRARSVALQQEARELCSTSREIRADNAILLDDLRVIKSSSAFVDLKHRLPRLSKVLTLHPALGNANLRPRNIFC